MARRNPTMFNPNRLKFGIFASNCSGGQAATTVPERWVASWDNNANLAVMADRLGIECMVPVGRWKGYGGETDFEGTTFETITWATGLLACTEDITVFGTVHCPLIHPVLAAKQSVTADHVGRGRFGLNIVCGWNQDEFNMFNVSQQAHDRRYEYGQEWWDIIRRIWSGEGAFDYEGEFFKLAGVTGSPTPWGGRRPVMMNAGSSPVGREFAGRNSDFHFDQVFFAEQAPQRVNDTRTVARRYGHDIQIFTHGYVVCRPTRREAEEYCHYFTVEREDTGAVDRLFALAMGEGGSEAISPEVARHARARFAGGYGGLPFVGDPDQVASELARMVDYGFNGMTISFVNYLDELPYFGAEVIPRLERMGLREPFVRIQE